MSFDGEQDESSALKPLINVADLARRWGVSERDVVEMVRHRGVPFLRMSHSIGRVKWGKVRFSVPAIEEWEATSQERFRSGQGAAPAPLPRKDRRKADAPRKSRLGDWKGSSSVG